MRYKKSKYNKINRKNSPFQTTKHRQPFWLPALKYYILTFSFAIIIFFLIWGILYEGGEESPFVMATLGAGLMFFSSVFIREVVLRKARRKYLLIQKQLDLQLKIIPPKQKLSLKQNATLLRNIEEKSKAANLFKKIAEGHWEVFLLCREYLELNDRELENAGIGSPRLSALHGGRKMASDLQKRHLFNWAKINTQELVEKSNNHIKVSDKLEAVQKAMTIMKTALKYYPDESSLTESMKALNEYKAKIKVSHWIEQAERQAYKGNIQRANDLYQDALFYLERENIGSQERELIVEQIHRAIKLLNKEKKKVNHSKRKH